MRRQSKDSYYSHSELLMILANKLLCAGMQHYPNNFQKPLFTTTVHIYIFKLNKYIYIYLCINFLTNVKAINRCLWKFLDREVKEGF